MPSATAGGAPERITRTEVLAPEPVEALAAMLDIEVPPGATVPPLWHWMYLLERRPQRELGPDGHPTTGIPAPPEAGCRRMFAGGRVATREILRLGEEATRSTWVSATREKLGRTGPLTFVTVRHEIHQGGQLAVVEEQDVVYRASCSALPPRTELPPEPPAPRQPFLTLEVDSRVLFRFSALTYNAHRIHYDHEWVHLEGYDDLVVHGPLQALLMGDLARRHGVSLLGKCFSYRLVSPMTGPQQLTVMAAENGLEHGCETRSARGAVTAISTLEDVGSPAANPAHVA